MEVQCEPTLLKRVKSGSLEGETHVCALKELLPSGGRNSPLCVGAPAEQGVPEASIGSSGVNG